MGQRLTDYLLTIENQRNNSLASHNTQQKLRGSKAMAKKVFTQLPTVFDIKKLRIGVAGSEDWQKATVAATAKTRPRTKV